MAKAGAETIREGDVADEPAAGGHGTKAPVIKSRQKPR
jgi:hypothetical protein